MAVIDVAPATSERAFGIVWAYRFHQDGSSEPIADSQLDEAFVSHRGWIWVHLSHADLRAHEWVSEHAPISAQARRVLLGRDEHQRLDIVGNEIIGVLVDIQMDLGQDTQETARLRFVITDRLLISVRRRPLRSVELTRQSLETGQKFPAAVSVLDTIIDHFADAIGKWAERMSDELDRVEDHVLENAVRDERQRLGQVRRQIVPMHRQLAQLKALFHRLDQRCAERDLALSTTIRALAQKLDSLDHEVASMQERARFLHDEIAAKMTDTTNRRLFTLSILTGGLLPPTLVTSFFGMNTKDLPLQQTDAGTWIALALCIASGAIAYWALARLRAL
jgi:zinc transporter